MIELGLPVLGDSLLGESQPTNRVGGTDSSSDYDGEGDSHDDSDGVQVAQPPPRTTPTRKRNRTEHFTDYQANTRGMKKVTGSNGQEYMTQSGTKTKAAPKEEEEDEEEDEEEEKEEQKEEVEEAEFEAKAIYDQEMQTNDCRCKKIGCVSTRQCATKTCDYYDKVAAKPCAKQHKALFYEVKWSGKDSDGKRHPNTWEHHSHLSGTLALKQWKREAHKDKERANRHRHLRSMVHLQK
jgi:hypothetical protein